MIPLFHMQARLINNEKIHLFIDLSAKYLLSTWYVCDVQVSLALGVADKQSQSITMHSM